MADVVALKALVDAGPQDAADRLAALFDAHHERLYRLARRLSRDGDDARDLVQDTYLRVAQKLESVPRDAFGEKRGSFGSSSTCVATAGGGLRCDVVSIRGI